MANRFINQAAPGLASLKPYVPGKPLSELERELGINGSIKLASNENPLGPSPRVRQALEAQIADIARYPDGGAFELRAALARRHAVEPACKRVGSTGPLSEWKRMAQSQRSPATASPQEPADHELPDHELPDHDVPDQDRPDHDVPFQT